MMVEHTDREFEHELRALKGRLSTMAERAAGQISLAMQALGTQNDDLAHQVVKNDAAIDADENEIDQLAMKILATRHPVANDLRFVTMALKFVVDVERIGDLAVGIAKRALELNRLAPLQPRGDLNKLATMVQKNLHLAIDSFVRGDVDQAAVVIRADAADRPAERQPVRPADLARRRRPRHGHPGTAADLGVSLSRKNWRSRQEPGRRSHLHGAGDGRPASHCLLNEQGLTPIQREFKS